MADQTVPSLTDRLADYLVNAFCDGRGYDPADPIDVGVTLSEGMAVVIDEMREDQAAGTATYSRDDRRVRRAAFISHLPDSELVGDWVVERDAPNSGVLLFSGDQQEAEAFLEGWRANGTDAAADPPPSDTEEA